MKSYSVIGRFGGHDFRAASRTAQDEFGYFAWIDVGPTGHFFAGEECPIKELVTEFHAIPVNKLARYPLTPGSTLDWIWRTQNGTHETTVHIAVLQDALHLLFPLGTERALQTVYLTHSRGARGGKRLWFLCPSGGRRIGVLYHQNGLPFGALTRRQRSLVTSHACLPERFSK